MSEGDNPQPRPAPAADELHWGISYLREDIQDLRQQMIETNRRIDETSRLLSQQIAETNKRIDAHFIWTIGTLVAITSILIAVIKL